MLNLEIAICTWNRADSLARTLNSINNTAMPEECLVKVIVVNNGSTDQTKQALADFESNKFQLHVIEEPTQGHSICRNRAIDAAEGDLLIWTDDDVIVSPDWLLGYAAAFAQQPDASFWGGAILPLLPEDTPAWVHENMDTLGGCYACRDLGDQPFKFSKSRLPYGANFAVRTSVQKDFRFDTTLGRKGHSLDGGDETELLSQLLDQNHIGYWVPKTALDHVIDPARLTEDWIQEYFKGQGRAMVRAGKPWSRMVWWLKLAGWYHNRRYQELRRNKSPSPAWMAQLIRSSLASGQVEALSNGQN